MCDHNHIDRFQDKIDEANQEAILTADADGTDQENATNHEEVPTANADGTDQENETADSQPARWIYLHFSHTFFQLILNCSTAENSVNFYTLERTLYRLARGNLPQSPLTAAEVAFAFQNEKIMERFGTTKSNEPSPFFRKVYVCSQFSYCVFASQSIIRRIETHIKIDERNFLLDATFKVCPMGDFRQLLVVYVEHHEQVNSETDLCMRMLC